MAVALHADAGRLTSQLCTLTPEGITSQFATNFPAPALLTRPALLPLERAGGTSSASVRQCVGTSVGQRARPGNSVYAAGEAAPELLTRSWAVEPAPRGIRVVAVAPDMIALPSAGIRV